MPLVVFVQYRKSCICRRVLGYGQVRRQKTPVPAMKEWEQDVRKIMDKSEKLKKLAAKYPLVVLHARYPYAGGQYKQSAFSFIYELTDWKKHLNDVQIVFGNGGEKDSFHTNMLTGQKTLLSTSERRFQGDTRSRAN